MRQLVITIALIAVVTSFVLFALSLISDRRLAESLVAQEQNILSRCGVVKDRFMFVAYPAHQHNSVICFMDESAQKNVKVLQLLKDGGVPDSRAGMRLYLTINLRPYKDTGSLEFMFKIDKDALLDTRLCVFLRDISEHPRLARACHSIEVTKEYQLISLPLKEFELIEETENPTDRDFDWDIKEITFSISPVVKGEKIKALIADLRVASEGKTIYALL